MDVLCQTIDVLCCRAVAAHMVAQASLHKEARQGATLEREHDGRERKAASRHLPPSPAPSTPSEPRTPTTRRPLGWVARCLRDDTLRDHPGRGGQSCAGARLAATQGGQAAAAGSVSSAAGMEERIEERLERRLEAGLSSKLSREVKRMETAVEKLLARAHGGHAQDARKQMGRGVKKAPGKKPPGRPPSSTAAEIKGKQVKEVKRAVKRAAEAGSPHGAEAVSPHGPPEMLAQDKLAAHESSRQKLASVAPVASVAPPAAVPRPKGGGDFWTATRISARMQPHATLPEAPVHGNAFEGSTCSDHDAVVPSSRFLSVAAGQVLAEGAPNAAHVHTSHAAHSAAAVPAAETSVACDVMGTTCDQVGGRQGDAGSRSGPDRSSPDLVGVGVRWLIRNHKLIVAGFHPGFCAKPASPDVDKSSVGKRTEMQRGDILRAIDGVDVLHLKQPPNAPHQVPLCPPDDRGKGGVNEVYVQGQHRRARQMTRVRLHARVHALGLACTWQTCDF